MLVFHVPPEDRVANKSQCDPCALRAGLGLVSLRGAAAPLLACAPGACLGVGRPSGLLPRVVALFAVALAACLAKRVARARRSAPQAAVAIPVDLEARSSAKPASAGEGPAALPSKEAVVVQGEPPSYQASVIHAIGLGF